ncbi:hypothetical protein F444_02137 [Phytophthora nicotianae P1976]|uniref:Uncharacterized protein n=1 Tax=Phytophthora nicotianae P1976 TaxID=1317066 RepID=A0A081AYF5_PHYNI|nr:hypothetical protein F444_02137 [Phytophthora nicotianae P1976]
MQDAVVVNAQQQVEGSGRGGVQGRGRGRCITAVEPAGRGQGQGRGRGRDSGRGRGEARGRGRDSGRGRERQRGRSTKSDQDESDAGSRAESDGGDDTSTHNGEVVPDRQTLCQLYTNTLVAFSPSRERWMTQKKYKHVGTTYIIGRICRCVQKSKQAPLLFQLRWLDSQFQKHAESITVDLIQKGHHNYNLLTRELNQIGWRSLCEQADDNAIVIVFQVETAFEAKRRARSKRNFT